MKRIIVLFIGVVSLLGFSACQQTNSEDLTRTSYALGTIITINLFDQGDEELMDALVARVSEIEHLMSRQESESEVSAISRAAGIAPVVVSDETYEVLSKALQYADLSGGKFDPTVAPVTGLWNIGTEEARVPSQAEIDQALTFVDYRKVILDEATKSVYLSVEGMSLDLGGIAKGYAADEVVRMLRQAGIKRAMINLGGNVYAYGEKSTGEPWKVAIHTPYDARSSYFAYVELKNKTVVTSGPYERYFEQDGQLYHHIFDAKTGYPVKGETVSVSIIAESSVDADAMSTLLFTMTPEEGLALVESMEGIECIYVDKDYGLKLSSGLVDVFTITDESYHIE